MASDVVVKITKILPRLLREFSKSFSNPLTAGAVTVPQLVLLEVLREKGMSTMSSVAKWMGITTSAVTGLTDRLIRAKFISRVRGIKDRRIVLVSLTDKGKDVVKKLQLYREKTVRKAFRNLTEKEQTEYLRLIRKIYEGLVKK